MDSEIIGLLIGSIGTLIIGFIKHKQDKKKTGLEIENLELENAKLKKDNEVKLEKLSFYDDFIKLVFYNSINDAAQDIFDKTKADRFLILIARNGKTDFNYVDVVLEFHKDSKKDLEAVKVYKNVKLDYQYKEMLKKSEYYGFVDLDTLKMESQILKHYYQYEKVNFSRIKSALRMPIDNDNDFLVFTSYATHSETNFTEQGLAIIDMIHDSIIKPSLKSLLEK